MKRIVGILVFALFLGNTFAQDISQGNVPAVVLNTFQLKFPNADNVKWKLDKGNYLVYFKVNQKDNKLTLNYKGNILKHSQDLYVSEIPKTVLETIRSKTAYFDVNDADRMEEGGKTTYHVKFKNGGEEYNFWIDDKGGLLKLRQGLSKDEIPAAILSFFEEKYGRFDIERAKYVEENGNINYIIGAEINDSGHVFWFDRKSNLLKHKQDLKDSEIPSPVLETIASAYKGYDIRDADMIEQRGKVIYTLRVRKSKENIYVTLNPDGKILGSK